MAHITFQQDKEFDEEDLGLSLLEMSHKHGIPHESACGGNARCSTCRVLVLDGADNLLPRNDKECGLARLKGFEPDVRLACQARVRGPVTVRRLVMDGTDAELAQDSDARTSGKEMTLAVLFSDIRNFTPFAESHLAYDVAHILNRYFLKMGEAVLRHDGYLDKYMGDGLMALFGLNDEDPVDACRKAVRAGLDMLKALPELNQYLCRFFDADMRIGIGIHAGVALVAEIGHPSRRQFTAIGDVVNVASRVESATKELGVPLLVSEAVRGHLGAELLVGKEAVAHLKGKSDDIRLSEVWGLAPGRQAAEGASPA